MLSHFRLVRACRHLLQGTCHREEVCGYCHSYGERHCQLDVGAQLFIDYCFSGGGGIGFSERYSKTGHVRWSAFLSFPMSMA